ncbi:hypothetical protein GDO81_012922, partial [Engystomops pustulosus]
VRIWSVVCDCCLSMAMMRLTCKIAGITDRLLVVTQVSEHIMNVMLDDMEGMCSVFIMLLYFLGMASALWTKDSDTND